MKSNLIIILVIFVLLWFTNSKAQTNSFIPENYFSRSLDFYFSRDLPETNQLFKLNDLTSSLADSIVAFNLAGDAFEKHFVEFDNNNFPITQIIKKYAGNRWENDVKTEIARNDKGIINSIYTKVWTGLEWTDSTRWLCELDDNGLVLQYKQQYWKGNNFVDSTLTISSYNENGHFLRTTWKLWDGLHWIDDYERTYEWDYQANSLQSINYYRRSGVWGAYQRNTYHLYSIDPVKVDSKVTETIVNGIWTIYSRYSIKYNSNGNETEYLYEYLKNNQWVNWEKELSEYDWKNRLISYTYYSWDGTEWQNYWEQIYTYNGNTITGYKNVNPLASWSRGFTYYYERDYSMFVNCHKIVIYLQSPSGLESEINVLPDPFTLSQNYPNPFNPSTKIEYEITKPQKVEISIYDISGRLVKELLNEEKNSGSYSVIWDGKNNTGNLVASGNYCYQIKSGDFVQAKKMILIK